MARNFVLFSITTLLAASVAHAQMPGEVFIVVDEPVLAPGESTTVRMWAGYDSAVDFAMAGIATSLLADLGVVEIGDPWSDVALVGRMAGPGTTRGTPEAGGYTGIIAGQFHWLQEPQFTDRSDPIAFWEATFTAPADAGEFTVNLSTLTTRFDVYIARQSSRTDSRLDGVTEGAATITIIPAPASAFVLLGALAMRRRR